MADPLRMISLLEAETTLLSRCIGRIEDEAVRAWYKMRASPSQNVVREMGILSRKKNRGGH